VLSSVVVVVIVVVVAAAVDFVVVVFAFLLSLIHKVCLVLLILNFVL